MPVSKKQLLPLNLASYDVFIEDTSVNSEYFNITRLPQYFTGGRNSFLIGGSDFLQDNSEILIEILDAENNTIFQTMVEEYIEGNSRMISVEIYDTTVTGLATIVIMGKAISTSNNITIPDEWKNTYNVRWTKNILVDYNIKNISPIKFLNTPEVSVIENRFYNINSSSYDTISIPFTASLIPTLTDGVQSGYRIGSEGTFKFEPKYQNGEITGSFKISSTGSLYQVYLPITKILNAYKAFTNGYLIPSSLNDGFITDLYLTSGSYVTQIYGVPYPITSSAKLKYSIISTSSVNIPISFAKLTVSNLNTVSGELYKIKVYNKVANDRSDYKLIADAYLDTNEILVSKSISGEVPIGNMYTTTNYSHNWCAAALEKNTGIRTSLYTVSGSPAYYNSYEDTVNQFSITSSNEVLLSSIYANVPINLSTNKFANKVSESGYFLGTKNSFGVFSTSEYTLTLDAYYNITSSSISLLGTTPKTDIYLIGTGSTKIIDRNPLGQKIGELIAIGGSQWFEKKQFNFIPAINYSGSLLLRFVVTNGFWNFANISIKPASDKQFSPDEVSLIIPNTEYHNELLQYKVEFFDINSNSADITAITSPVFFTGSALDLGTLS